MAEPIRIANCSGFLGDRHTAAREMVEGGPIDVLTGDYLAELTMAILARQRLKDPAAGYARQFLDHIDGILGKCLDDGIKIVVNAGGNAARINGVSYSIADDSALVSDARARAFTDAENRARQYAELAGLSLGTVISISEASGGGPTPRPIPMERGAPMAAADVPLSPGEQTVSFSVTAVWELN